MLDNLKIKSMLLSEVPKTDKTGWKHYCYHVAIVDNRGTIVWDGKYRMGIGRVKDVRECGYIRAEYTRCKDHLMIEIPKLKDVIHSLLSDGAYTDFADFCDNLGYDKDSIKNKKLFRKCMKNYQRLVAYFGKDNMAKLHEMFQDY